MEAAALLVPLLLLRPFDRPSRRCRVASRQAPAPRLALLLLRCDRALGFVVFRLGLDFLLQQLLLHWQLHLQPRQRSNSPLLPRRSPSPFQRRNRTVSRCFREAQPRQGPLQRLCRPLPLRLQLSPRLVVSAIRARYRHLAAFPAAAARPQRLPQQLALVLEPLEAAGLSHEARAGLGLLERRL